MDLGSLLPGSVEDKFLRLPYAERLEKLKPIIVQLYMGNYGPGGKRMTMRHVTEFMKDKYSFHMALVLHLSFLSTFSPSQYYSFTDAI